MGLIARAALLALLAQSAVAATATAPVGFFAEHTAGPWPLSEFAPPAGARAPSHVFEGRLHLGESLPGGGFRVLLDRYGDARSDGGAARRLPGLDIELVQDGDVLIPAARGPLHSSHPQWEFVIEPGRVWDQDGDGEWTRAALPFALEERNANCMHNGVLTFLFGTGGRISHVAFEIAHETCAYFQFDAWGLVQARYEPQVSPRRAALVAAWGRESVGRIPTRPIATLAVDHPGVDAAQFGSAAEVKPADMTLYGVLVDGVHYTGGCNTRFGPYPYCDELDLPSYSVAKTLVGGIAAMRAAAIDPAVPAMPIARLVPECAGGGWDGVTVADALNMATGHYESDADQADEGNADLLPFFLAEDHATRIRFACRHYPRRVEPGERWVYHTSDSYLLGTALAAWYRGRSGAGADFFQGLLVVPIWQGLGLSPTAAATRRTRDAVRQPFTGYGLTLKRDDVVKLARFLVAGDGDIGGQPVIDPVMLRAGLERDPARPGLRADSDTLRYRNAFWAWNAQQTLGCAAPVWIPFMSGFGGIIVALLPNGIVYYYFSDGGAFSWARAVREADRIHPLCRSGR